MQIKEIKFNMNINTFTRRSFLLGLNIMLLMEEDLTCKLVLMNTLEEKNNKLIKKKIQFKFILMDCLLLICQFNSMNQSYLNKNSNLLGAVIITRLANPWKNSQYLNYQRLRWSYKLREKLLKRGLPQPKIQNLNLYLIVSKIW
jgi:hypothetical protein